jgi:hypothetical protein
VLLVTPEIQPLIKVAPVLHERGIEQARKRAEWELGDSNWADIIVRAYLNPLEDNITLTREMRD